jgi:hypothetical protein
MVSRVAKSVPVSEIVDFEPQLKLFHGMLADPTERRLMFIQAPGGRGKTCLLRLMRRHCKEQGLPCCWADFRGESYDNPHLTLAREICDQLGLVPRHLAEALLPFSAPATEVSAEVQEVRDSKVITAGRDVIECQQVVMTVSATNENLRERYVKERLKRAFVAELADLAADKGGVVCFLDHFEDVSDEEERWLLEALLYPVRENELRKVVVVTGGQRWPKIDDWEWEESTYLINGLPPMSVEHIKAYAKKIQVKISHEEAEFCWRLCRGGIPYFMGMVVKNLRAMMEVRP